MKGEVSVWLEFAHAFVFPFRSLASVSFEALSLSHVADLETSQLTKNSAVENLDFLMISSQDIHGKRV